MLSYVNYDLQFLLSQTAENNPIVNQVHMKVCLILVRFKGGKIMKDIF